MSHLLPTSGIVFAALFALETLAAPLTGWRGDGTGAYPDPPPPQTRSKT
jgi:hypothetical protein